MKKYHIQLEDYLASFYNKIAECAGLTIERVLEDTLYKTVGELAERIANQNKNKS